MSAFCLELLGDDPWKASHAASHAAYLIAAECYHLAGDDGAALGTIDAIEANAQSLLERVPALALKVTLITNQGRLDDATRVSLETLALFGVQLPDPRDPAALGQAIGEGFGAYQRALGGRELASLRELPAMTDPEKHDSLPSRRDGVARLFRLQRLFRRRSSRNRCLLRCWRCTGCTS